MPYYYLATSLNEFGNIATLVEKLELVGYPLLEFKNKDYVRLEIDKIKRSAARDVLFFGKHYRHYVRIQLCCVYDMIIRLHEILKNLPEVVLRAALTQEQYDYCAFLLAELLQLEVFYNQLIAG